MLRACGYLLIAKVNVNYLTLWNAYFLDHVSILSFSILQMIDDQDLGFFANFLGIFIFILVIAYHYVMADPKYEGNQC